MQYKIIQKSTGMLITFEISIFLYLFRKSTLTSHFSGASLLKAPVIHTKSYKKTAVNVEGMRFTAVL